MTTLRSSLLAPALALALLPACQPGSDGPLDPLAGPGVARVVDARQGPAALVQENGLALRVSARWHSEGAQTVRISYRNRGPTPARIRIGDLKLVRGGGGEAVLWTAADVTGVDLTDARVDNDAAKILYAVDSPATNATVLTVPVGASRDIDADLAGLSDKQPITAGDRVVAIVPVGARTVRVTFTAIRPRLLPPS